MSGLQGRDEETALQAEQRNGPSASGAKACAREGGDGHRFLGVKMRKHED
jgi:hypothetical protein